MKLTITKTEVDALIRSSYDLPHDAEVEIVNTEANHHDWIINTQTDYECPLDVDPDELVDIVYSNGVVRIGLNAISLFQASWSVKSKIHIVKYRKHRG
jgi:hypothetical protein